MYEKGCRKLIRFQRGMLKWPCRKNGKFSSDKNSLINSTENDNSKNGFFNFMECEGNFN